MINLTKDTKNLENLIYLILSLGAYNYIISSAFLPINGAHEWRQSVVLGHTLGLIENNGFQFGFRFNGSPKSFDLPIYQWIIAKLTVLFSSDILVAAKVLNSVLWLLSVLPIAYFLKKKSGFISGLIFLILTTVSPLTLHFYSIILPDTLAIALCSVAIYFLLTYELNSLSLKFFSVALIGLATLIKPQITFVYWVFISSYLIFSYYADKRYLKYNFIHLLSFIIASSLFLIFIVFISELFRSFSNNSSSLEILSHKKYLLMYFGDLSLRFSQEMWLLMFNRFNDWISFVRYTGYFWYIFAFAFILSISIVDIRKVSPILFSSLISYIVGWLTFTKLYMLHNYYQLPSLFVFMASVSFCYGEIIKKYQFSLNKELTNKLNLLLVFASLVFSFCITLTDSYYSLRSRTSAQTTVEFILGKYNKILIVITPTKNNNVPTDPSLGARYMQKFDIVLIDEFSNECLTHLKNYEAIIVYGEARCGKFPFLQVDENIRLFSRKLIKDKG